MASLSMTATQPGNLNTLCNAAPPRHTRKHSRHPTAGAPLPSFSFNPGASHDEVSKMSSDKDDDVFNPQTSAPVQRVSKPAPLPEFSFNPGADLPDDRTPSPSHPVLEEMALNQQRLSKSARPAPLPVFTFNPGQAHGSLASSPTKLEPDGEGIKSGGHRRGGSEFVGGKAEGAQLVVPSPPKQDTRPSGPPVAGLRGHSHKRSQAISVSDIDTSDLIKQHALAKARAPSNPPTPRDNAFPFPRPTSGQRHSLSISTRSPPASPRRRENMSMYRSRTVDFSDTVDVIPRPLSMISSETERSNSTIRGHSLSNSINSFTSPPPDSIMESPRSASPAMADASLNRRPSTADATLTLSDSIRHDETLLSMPKRPLSASGSPMVPSPGNPPPRKKHFWSAQEAEPSPTPTPRQEKTDPFADIALPKLPSDPDRARPKTAPERSSTHKRRKYHTWTAGIFSKKSKHRTPKAKPKRSPTPPSLLRRNSDLVNDIFDADDTVVLREDSPVGSRKQSRLSQNLPVPSLPLDTEISSPVLDIDAALAPSGNDRRHSDDHARRTSTKISKLHSSERRGIVDAFGVSHRRTESAPALSPVNRTALFASSRHGSNTSLSEDVFDEEEEDDFLAKEEKTKSASTEQSAAAPDTVLTAAREAGLGLTNVSSHDDGVLIVDPEQEAESEDVRSSKSTIEAPTTTEEDIPKKPATSPMSFAYPNPQSHYASSTEGRTTSASLISSPDAEHVSFDAQTRPRRYGEPGADFLRPSTDDLPSLSDSVSSSTFRQGSSSGNARPSLDHRSNSMFIPGSSRLHENWKRSSLASLNRLMPGSAHGSKSKLEGLPAPVEDKSKKKNNRLSKLIRFWRSKEDLGKENSA